MTEIIIFRPINDKVIQIAIKKKEKRRMNSIIILLPTVHPFAETGMSKLEATISNYI